MSGGASLAFDFYQPFCPGSSKDGRPLFTTANGVHGTVKLDYCSTAPALDNVDFIKLYLCGFVQVMIPRNRGPNHDETPAYSKLTRKILNIVDVLPIKSSSTCNANASTTHVSVKFDLTLPSTAPHSTEISTHCRPQLPISANPGSPLPSSLSVSTVVASSPPGYGQKIEARVVYTLQAYVIRKGEVMASNSKEIRIFNSGDPEPPSCISDFSTEYQCRQRQVLRKHIFSNVGTLSAVVIEPDPFIFCRGKELISTKLPISFKMERPSTLVSRDATSSVEDIDAAVTWRLKISTFASVEPMKSLPTLTEVNKSAFTKAPSMTIITSVGLKHQLKLNLRGWQKKPGDLSGKKIDSSSETWMTKEELALSIPQTALIAPTFFTEFVSRRYSLLLQIKATGHGKANLQLEVPVQVVYQDEVSNTNLSNGRESNCLRDSYDWICSRDAIGANVDTELPMYVR